MVNHRLCITSSRAGTRNEEHDVTITEGWTTTTNFLARLVERSIHTICLLLIGALMGAWIVHLTEAPQAQQRYDEVGKLGKSLNLCMEEKELKQPTWAQLQWLLRRASNHD
jgi:hypothetical protein